MPFNKESIINILSKNAFFDALSAEELSFFAKNIKCESYKNKQQLFLQGDQADILYIVAKGWVKLFRETIDGKESIINLVTLCDSIGNEVISENTHYPYSAEVVDEATLLALPISIIRQRLENDGKLAVKMLGALAKQMTLLETQLEQLMIMTAPKRIGCFLLKLTLGQNSGSANLALPYDKALIASKLGMQAETFSRSIQNLKKYGVTVEDTRVHIKEVFALREYVCQTCSNPAECDEEKANECGQLCGVEASGQGQTSA